MTMIQRGDVVMKCTLCLVTRSAVWNLMPFRKQQHHGD